MLVCHSYFFIGEVFGSFDILKNWVVFLLLSFELRILNSSNLSNIHIENLLKCIITCVFRNWQSMLIRLCIGDGRKESSLRQEQRLQKPKGPLGPYLVLHEEQSSKPTRQWSGDTHSHLPKTTSLGT